MDKIGRYRFALIVSDSTGNTLKTRLLIDDEVKTILKLPDTTHHLGNTGKSIAKLDYFKETIAHIRTTLSYWLKSNLGIAALAAVRDDYGPARGLETTGSTRFCGLLLSAISVERNYDAIQKTVDLNPDLEFSVRKLLLICFSIFAYICRSSARTYTTSSLTMQGSTDGDWDSSLTLGWLLQKPLHVRNPTRLPQIMFIWFGTQPFARQWTTSKPVSFLTVLSSRSWES